MITDDVLERYEKRVGSLEKAICFKFVFVLEDSRGKNLGARMMKKMAEYLHEKKIADLFYAFISGVRLMSGLLKLGFKIEETKLYSEATYNG